MELPADDLNELESGEVLRLAIANPALVAPGTSRPLPALFSLDPKDVKEAKETGRPHMLSVFDRSRTTVAQAWAVFARPGHRFAFELEVVQVRELSSLLPKNAPQVTVLRNLLLPPERREMLGSDGHCGMTGLHKPERMEKRFYKNLRAELCRIARSVSSE